VQGKAEAAGQQKVCCGIAVSIYSTVFHSSGREMFQAAVLEQ